MYVYCILPFQTIAMKHALGKKYHFCMWLWIQYNSSPDRSLFLDVLFSIDFIYFQSDISTEVFTLISTLLWHFCDLECKELLAKDLLDWCWEEKEKNSAHSRCFFSSCCAYLKNWHCLKADFRCSVFWQQEWMCCSTRRSVSIV